MIIYNLTKMNPSLRFKGMIPIKQFISSMINNYYRFALAVNKFVLIGIDIVVLNQIMSKIRKNYSSNVKKVLYLKLTNYRFLF